jgi:rhodanese-related sulfurtransferase
MREQTISRRAVVGVLAAAVWGTVPTVSVAQAVSDSVSLDYARAEFEAGRAVLIDIREPSEHATGVAKGVQLLPMRQIGARISEIPNGTSRPVLLICNTQNRSSATLKALQSRGFTNVRFVQGGMSEWNRRGWPTVRP